MRMKFVIEIAGTALLAIGCTVEIPFLEQAEQQTEAPRREDTVDAGQSDDAALGDGASQGRDSSTSTCSCAGLECGQNACGEACGPGCGGDDLCLDGRCVTGECPEGTYACDGVCSNLISDTANCGFCGRGCPGDPHGDALCVQAECGVRCDSGFRLCDGACARCPTGATQTACSGGQCEALACAGAAIPCGTTCAACGEHVAEATCGAQDQCVASACQTAYLLCDDGCACADVDAGGRTGRGVASGTADGSCAATFIDDVFSRWDDDVMVRWRAPGAGRYAFVGERSADDCELELFGDCADSSLVATSAWNVCGLEHEVVAGQALRVRLHQDSDGQPWDFALDVRGPLRDADPHTLRHDFENSWPRQLYINQYGAETQMTLSFEVPESVQRFAGLITLDLDIQLNSGGLDVSLSHAGETETVHTASTWYNAVWSETFDQFAWHEAAGTWTLVFTLARYSSSSSSDLILKNVMTLSLDGPAWE